MSAAEIMQCSVLDVRNSCILTSYHLTPEMLSVTKFIHENCSSWMGGTIIR